MSKSLDHIIVAVEALEPAAERWAALLGLEPVWRGSHPQQGTANVLFNFGDFYLELMAAVGSGGHAERVTNFIAKRGEGVFGASYSCASIEAAAKKLGAEVVAGEGLSSDNRRREWKLAMPSLSNTEGLLLFAIEHLSPPLPMPHFSKDSVQNLDHLVIMTSRVEEVKSLLADKVELRLALDHTRPDYGARQLFFRFDNHKTIEVAQPLKGGAVETAFWGLAWRVADIAKTHARLSASGAFNISEVRTGRKKGTKVFTVRDAPSAIPTLVIAKE